MNYFFGGSEGGVVAARISGIFFYKESGKLFSFIKNPNLFFYIKNPNLTKKKSGGWEGRGWGCG